MKKISEPLKEVKEQELHSAEDLQIERDIETFANIIIETFLKQINKEAEDCKEKRLGDTNEPIA